MSSNANRESNSQISLCRYPVVTEGPGLRLNTCIYIATAPPWRYNLLRYEPISIQTHFFSDGTYIQEHGAKEPQRRPRNQNSKAISQRDSDLPNNLLSQMAGQTLEKRTTRPCRQSLDILGGGIWKKWAELLEADVLEQRTGDGEKGNCAEGLCCLISVSEI